MFHRLILDGVWVSGIFIRRDYLWGLSVSCFQPFAGTLCYFAIAFNTQLEVQRVTCIHRLIQIPPSSLHLDGCFIHSP